MGHYWVEGGNGLHCVMWLETAYNGLALRICRVHVTDVAGNDHPNPSQGRQMGFRKRQVLKNLHATPNNLNNSILGAFWEPMAQATWA